MEMGRKREREGVDKDRGIELEVWRERERASDLERVDT